MEVILLRHLNRFILDTFDQRGAELVPQFAPEFTATYRFKPHGDRKAKIQFVTRKLYGIDAFGRMVVTLGSYEKLKALILKAGFSLTEKIVKPHPRPYAYDVDPAGPEKAGIELRYRQAEFLQNIMAYECGRYDCVPGFGKTMMAVAIALLYPKAKILVTTRGLSLTHSRIYPEMLGFIPNVGLVGGGHRRHERCRVVVASASSLSILDAMSYDIVIVDECHQAGSDKYAEQLGRFLCARIYGLSGSQDMRWDGKSRRVEAIFGPVRMKVDYLEAEKANIVSSVRVIWRRVRSKVAVDSEKMDTVRRKRLFIWRCEERNRLIQKDARSYTPDTQVLIVTDTIDHALHLKKLLPEFTLVYQHGAMEGWIRFKGRNIKKYVYYKNLGLLPREPAMTLARRLWLTKAFEQNRLKKVIATTVFNVGVSMNHLAVLIRADGASARERNVQIPGRLMRKAVGKDYGVVHDYWDEHNKTQLNCSKSRYADYKLQGFSQFMRG